MSKRKKYTKKSFEICGKKTRRKGKKRGYGTKGSGKDFSKEEEQAVWNKLKPRGNKRVKYDICGREIHFNQYGKEANKSKYKWEFDHIKPVSRGGKDHLRNLQALYWKTNKLKDNMWPATPECYCDLEKDKKSEKKKGKKKSMKKNKVKKLSKKKKKVKE